MDWPIQEIARLSGTTSRTLRHYDQIGLLAPSRIAPNGYRHYDQAALVRLQRILLLRELGLGLPAIATVLDNEQATPRTLHAHLGWLRQEQERLARQVASVETTLTAMEEGTPLMAENILDGFDHTHYKDEVTERWGAEAYAASDTWWRSKSAAEKAEFQNTHKQIAADYAAARESGLSADSAEVQAIAERHLAWLNLSATATGPVTAARFAGFGDLYVADPRFAKNYGGPAGAEFVREAMRHFAANADWPIAE